jgi:DNA-binding NtrC family response regulator
VALSRSECRILVVEDQVEVRRLIAKWLHRNGFATFEADHADGAIAWLRRHFYSIDLAIIDLCGTNGLDLAAEMSRDHRHIQILYISGFVDSLVVEAIGQRAPESLLLKPLSERALIHRVRRLLELPGSMDPKLEQALVRPRAFQRRCNEGTTGT